MRKIEQEMIAAVKARRNWKCENTEVRIDSLCGIDRAFVYLHGNLIAQFEKGAYPNNNTWQTWPTRTTASRLRALGFVYDKKADRWN